MNCICVKNNGGIHGTVVARWTAGQQAKQSIMRQGHGSQQNSSHSSRLSPVQYSISSAEQWPKTPVIHCVKNKNPRVQHEV